MGQEILVIGQSGSGKSTSMRNLNPKETVIINPTKKALPFKGYKSNYTEFSKQNPEGNLFNVDTAAEIIQVMEHVNTKMPHIKNIILDDGNYVMAFEFIKRAKESGFAKFTDIGTNYSNIITKGSGLRADLNFIVFMHPEIDTDTFGNRITKAKTVGKLVDQYLNIEGMFSIVLYTKVKSNDKGVDYVFITQNDGSNTGKSPMGMFPQEIPNDLKVVLDKVEEYSK
jgi:septin family protein